MTFGLSSLFLAIAAILMILSAVPPLRYGTSLLRLGFAFVVLAVLVGGR